MGCGGSRMNADREPVPAGVRPAIHRRIEEIRRRRRAGSIKETTSSKKELLSINSKATDHDHESVLNDHHHHKNDRTEDSVASCLTSEGSLKGPQPEKSIKKHDKEVDDKVVLADDNKKAERKNDCQEQEEEEGGFSNEDSIAFPGSPSFRVYFTDNFHIKDVDDDDTDHHGNEAGEKSDQKKYEETDNTPSPDQSTPVKKESEEPVAKKEDKEKKSGRLRMAMQRGGQSSVKNLFNVRSCLSPSSQNRADLLTGKQTA